MKTRFCPVILLLTLSLPLFAQKSVSDFITTGDDKFSIINISRSDNFQEKRGASKVVQGVYFNDRLVCELSCPGRVSIKVFSEGLLKLSVKYVSSEVFKQKVIDKKFLSGDLLELNVAHGKTYFLNVDTKLVDGLQIFWTAKLVSIPESEEMFKDEARYVKAPEIKGFQEDINNTFIKSKQ